MNAKRQKDRVDAFLKCHGMHHGSIDLDTCLDDYVTEMDKGLREPGSMLLMLPTYVGLGRGIVKNQCVVAMDAGGTNLRLALCTTDGTGRVSIRNHRHYVMPGCEDEIDHKTFFRLLAGRLEPFAKESKTVCVSFAYPTEATPSLDGRIIRMSKEMRINGIEGLMFGENLQKALHNNGVPDCRVLVTNDTVATALAGMTQENMADSFIGLVLGTGINTSYIEKTENIRRPYAKGDGETMLINVESGNYANQPRGDLDISFDQTTKNPGKQTLEKMISGAYLGALIHHVIQASEQEQLLSDAFYGAFGRMICLGTTDLTLFIDEQKSDLYDACLQTGDKIALLHLIHSLIKRAAKLTALQVAGAAVKCGKGRLAQNPVCVSVEGSTYQRLPGIKREIGAILGDWLKNERGIYTNTIRVDHAVIKGASVLGFLL